MPGAMAQDILGVADQVKGRPDVPASGLALGLDCVQPCQELG
ncbi:hypothetical protein [Streptomyces sp. NPDC048445]